MSRNKPQHFKNEKYLQYTNGELTDKQLIDKLQLTQINYILLYKDTSGNLSSCSTHVCQCTFS